MPPSSWHFLGPGTPKRRSSRIAAKSQACLTYEDGLRTALAVVQLEQHRFGASPVLGFNRGKFFLGQAKAFGSIYIAGRWPQHYYLWHCLQFCILTPIHAWRWSQPSLAGLAYFVEFCWAANFSMTIYLISLGVYPEKFDRETRATALRTLFAFGAGPLGVVFSARHRLSRSPPFTVCKSCLQADRWCFLEMRSSRTAWTT